MHHEDYIQVRQNLSIVIRERGKIVGRRDGHNIFVNLGREWLPKLVCYAALPVPPAIAPITPAEDRRIRYMGVGIGGTRQLMLSVANAAPLSTYYPGTNAQVDTNQTVQRLERPVRLTSPIPFNPSLPPAYNVPPGDVWLGQIQAPCTFPSATSVSFKRLILEDEVSYGPFLSVPICEIMLFPHSADINFVHRSDNVGFAYDTFDSISKTSAFALETTWTWRF